MTEAPDFVVCHDHSPPELAAGSGLLLPAMLVAAAATPVDYMQLNTTKGVLQQVDYSLPT
jgi:hypothetical protein